MLTARGHRSTWIHACVGLLAAWLAVQCSAAQAANWMPSPGMPGLNVWLDASDASTLTINPSNPAQVLGWRDKSGQNSNATGDPSYAPSLSTLNGMSTIDFGPYGYGTTANPHMYMPGQISVQTVFIIWGSANGGGFMLTDTDGYWWHRSAPAGGGSASDPIFDNVSGYSDPNLRSGDADTRVNGTLIDPTTTGLSGNWDMVTTRTVSGSALPFNTLSLDRVFRSGGQGIAELITFNARLSVTEVQRIEGYLAWKWGLQGKLAATHPYKTHAPVIGPMAQYHFDETAYAGAAGEVKDSSPNGLHGTAIGSPLPVPQSTSPAIAGALGTCGNVLFQGAANGGAALAFSGLPVHTEAGAQTSVSFWMYWDGRDYALPIGWNQYNLWLTSNNLVFNTNGQGLYGISAAGLANSWHHIVGVFTNGNYAGNRLYVDGVEQTLTTWQPLNDSISYVSSTLQASGWPTNADVRYGGRLDELQVFDGALTQSEVSALYTQAHACPGVPPATLLAEYRFEEGGWTGASGELLDSSGNSHAGKAIGSPLPTPASSSPARAGDPGSCHYAALSGPHSGGSAFQIDGLPVSTSAGDVTSVSFWMFWDGTDDAMPIGWYMYDLWFSGGAFGFNSFNADVWGISSAGLANGWHHIAATFVNGNLTASQLYVDGVVRTLSQRLASPNNGNASASPTVYIGAAGYDGSHRLSGYLDDVRVYTGVLTAAQVTAAMNATHPCGIAPSSVGGFNAFESATTAGAVSGYIHTKVAGTSFTIDAVAVGADHASVLTRFYGDVKIELLDASDNSGGVDSTTQCRSTWQAVSGNAGATLTFAASDAGRKSFSLGEANAWRDARLRLSWPATGTASTVACSSDDFAIRPSAFANFGVSDADSATAGSARTLDNVTASGGNVHKAGRPFTITATAVNAASATATGYTGTPAPLLSPCTGTACVSGWTTIAIQGESFSFSGTRSVRYGHDTRYNTLSLSGGGDCNNTVFGDPAPGVTDKHCDIAGLGALALSPAVAAGVVNASSTYSEAGSFALQLVDTTFASVDASDGSSAGEMTIASPVVNVGRFVPDHFELVSLAAPILRTFDSGSCAARSFTYLGQPFGYVSTAQATLVARNAAGATTTLYANALWKLGASSLAQGYAPTPTTPGLDSSAINAVSLTSNGDGTGLVAGAPADKLAFVRPGTAPIAPFNANIALSWSATDASEAGVTGNGSITTPTPLVFANIGFDAGSQMRFGMLRLTPAYGSELINLPVLVEAQYWDGQRMATNAADQCTTFAPAAVAMGNYQRSLAACKTALGSTSITLASGRGYLKLSRPGSGIAGSVDLALQLGATAAGQSCATSGAAAPATTAGLPWLQGRWGNAAGFDQNPSTRASFGQYRSPLIYQREMY